MTIVKTYAPHGGMDGGCSTADGKTEKGINLNILLSVRDLSRFFGYDVDVTRDRDTSIHDKGVTGIRNQKVSDMENRLELFNKYPNAVCVSIHQNTFSDPQYSGAQMFYSDKNPASEQLAGIMQRKFVGNLQPENQRETKLCGSELYLCYYCSNPAVMVECGFLSNPEEAAKLTDETYQQKVAFTVFSGIIEFTGSAA
ncbi:MAG: N-acetylmuramoyl-L-alanine amidase [Ruminococcus sp.]|nr:N-acetylmuramoyl-L-alanine amidase [Ruminococcus sp.]MCM1478769.1 N-acetylmuramoyl-L-alanine amidase [Muribaculaceae bacterium]